MRLFIFASILSVLTFSCTVHKYNKGSFETMKWIEGTWQEINEDVVMKETWIYKAGYGYDVVSRIFLNDQEIYKESFSVLLSDKQISIQYRTNEEPQDNLYLKKLKKESFTFSNKEQKRVITYTFKDSQSIQLNLQEIAEGKLKRSKHILQKM